MECGPFHEPDSFAPFASPRLEPLDTLLDTNDGMLFSTRSPTLPAVDVWSWVGQGELESSSGGQTASCPDGSSAIETATASTTPLPALPTSRNARRHECLQCRQTFSTGHDLEGHAVLHHHRTFACPAPGCRKVYTRRDLCARHSATHETTKKHACSVCWADFVRKDHLKRHMRQHLDDSSMCSGRPRTPILANIDIKKVRESEPALRKSLSQDNLAIRMLDIAGQAESPEEGAKKAFACVVARAALNAPGALTPDTKDRMEAIVKPGKDRVAFNLDVLKALEVN